MRRRQKLKFEIFWREALLRALIFATLSYFLAKLRWTVNWSLYPQGLTRGEKFAQFVGDSIFKNFKQVKSNKHSTPCLFSKNIKSDKSEKSTKNHFFFEDQKASRIECEKVWILVPLAKLSKLSKNLCIELSHTDAGGKLDAPCPAACVWYPIGSACCSEARLKNLFLQQFNCCYSFLKRYKVKIWLFFADFIKK